MPKIIKSPPTNLLNSLNLTIIIRVALFFLALTRVTKAYESAEIDKNLNEPFQSLNHQNLAALLSIYPSVKQGELVDKNACDIKIEPLQTTELLTSNHGFTLFIPQPTSLLAQLITNLLIIFTGNAEDKIKQKHTAMLKKVLPAVGNHQLLAKTLSNSKFQFIIDYSDGLEKMLGAQAKAATHESFMVIVLSADLFEEESYLLGLLRNEFATMNVIIANDCRLGHYDETILRSSPFLLDRFSQKISSPSKSVNQETKAVMNTILKNHDNFMELENNFMAMSHGSMKKSPQFEQLETHLENYIPTPKFKGLKKFLVDEFFTPENKRVDEYFDVYVVKKPGSKQTAFYYIFPNSYRIINNNDVFFHMFETDPRRIHGKLEMLYQRLTEGKKILEGNKNAFYKAKPFVERYIEWLSVLENNLPPAFLQFIFPDYCEHMTEYTQLDQDNQYYCAP